MSEANRDKSLPLAATPCSAFSADVELISNLQEWAEELRSAQHPATLTLLRAIQALKINEQAAEALRVLLAAWIEEWEMMKMGRDETPLNHRDRIQWDAIAMLQKARIDDLCSVIQGELPKRLQSPVS